MPEMFNGVSLPRLRGQALSCFTKHYVGGLIQTKLRSISIRTREHRKQASSAIWKFLLCSRNLVRNYNTFIAPYSPIMGQLNYKDGSFAIERLFGRPLKLPLDVFRLLIEKKRLPLFTESSIVGFDEIDLSFEVAARELKWRCARMASSFYSMDKFNPYVNTLYLESSTFAIEWTFDLLNSVNKVFPSIKTVHLRYYHVPQTTNELLPCFLQENGQNYELVEFVSNLKIDNLNATEFIGMFSKLISEQIPTVDFQIDIIWPVKGCNLAALRNSYAEKNLRIHFIKISSKFDLLRK